MFEQKEAAPEQKTYRINRRAWVRHSCHQDTSCHPVEARSGVFWSAKVDNISSGGIALVLDRRFNIGTILSMRLQGATPDSSRKVLVRVIHDSLLTAHPGLRWLVGCAFLEPLSDQELQQLLV